jgi:hypothetical protein
LNDDGASALQIAVKSVEVINVQIDVPLEGLPFSLQSFASPDLKMNPDAVTLHDRVNATWFVLSWLKNSVCRIKAEAQHIAVILRSLSHLPNTKDRRGPPRFPAHNAYLPLWLAPNRLRTAHRPRFVVLKGT